MEKKDELSITDAYRRATLTFQQIRTANPVMREALQIAKEVAVHDIPVMILGDNGTGKNLLAQAIHTAGPRGEKQFVPVNSSAIPESLLESELFGHEKGAFTNADRVRRGRFELAREGTLFLDEIADLTPSAQAKILRVAEYGQFERVGGETTLKTDARLITATNKDILAMVRDGQFREDLYFRLRGVVIRIPALKERPEDIPLLSTTLLEDANRKYGKSVTGISSAVMDLFLRYSWPGNVREFKSVIASAVITERGETLSVDNRTLTSLTEEPMLPGRPGEDSDIYSMEEMEKRHIISVLRRSGGNKAKACRLLGISRPTLDRKISKFDIEIDRLKDG
ncbi:MAG: sigma-54 interaction domain-containing protein [Planctomycetota bacterium]|jgi:transcriptional regulator with PAS, ATPase and Fis domain